MRADLAAWEAAPPSGAPALLVVSTGTPDDVRAEDFAAAVVLDRDGKVAAALGANGTPMAVLVDADARIASPVVAGGTQALALLAAHAPALTE
jgi:hypothetical protein